RWASPSSNDRKRRSFAAAPKWCQSYRDRDWRRIHWPGASAGVSHDTVPVSAPRHKSPGEKHLHRPPCGGRETLLVVDALGPAKRSEDCGATYRATATTAVGE